jgi:hypothetical protein
MVIDVRFSMKQKENPLRSLFLFEKHATSFKIASLKHLFKTKPCTIRLKDKFLDYYKIILFTK